MSVYLLWSYIHTILSMHNTIVEHKVAVKYRVDLLSIMMIDDIPMLTCNPTVLMVKFVVFFSQCHSVAP